MNKNNWGIIGYGRIARRFIDNLNQTDGHLYAIASKSAKEVPTGVILYHDYESLLNDPNVDCVYIALTHKLHYDVLMNCIMHHKPVLCEKPMVLTKEQMNNVLKLAKEKQVLVVEALKTRFIPAYHQLKKDIETIELQSIRCGFCYEIPYIADHYLYDLEQGGALNDVGTYSIGFVLDLVNSEILEVRSNVKKDYGVDVHFNTHVVFKNGIIADLEGAMDEKKENNGDLEGKKGKIVVSNFYRPAKYQVEYNDGTILERDFEPSYDMKYEIEEMMKLVNQNEVESSLMSLEDSLKIVEMMENIRKDGR